MEWIRYKEGHKIPIKLVENTLKGIGCKDIKDNNYKKRARGNAECETFNGLIPDFICSLLGKKTAVEVGKIHGYYEGTEKIHKLLDYLDYVIHIYSDDTYFILHCVLYKSRYMVPDKDLKTLREQANFCENLLKKLEGGRK